MKTKAFNKKDKKRSHSESFLSTKPNQKEKSIDQLKKNAKKPKLDISTENGNFTAKTVQFSKQVDKQGKKKNKDVKQSNIESSETERKALLEKVTFVQPIKKNEKLENLKKKPLTQDLHKGKQTQKSFATSTAQQQSIEQLKEKIEEIKSREVLSKTAKRKLSTLKKKLQIAETNAGKLGATEKKSDKQENQGISVSVKNKQKINKDKKELGKKNVQNEKDKTKSEDDDFESSDEFQDDDDSDAEDVSMNNIEEFDDESDEVEGEEEDMNDDDDEDDETDESDEFDESDESDELDESKESKTEKKIKDVGQKPKMKVNVEEEDDIEDEEDEDDEDEDEEDEEDEEVDIEDEEDEDEEDVEDDEDEEDEEDVDKNKIAEKKEKKDVQSSDHQKKQEAKKKRYVLYVNNISYDTTTEELIDHFRTKLKIDLVTARLQTDSNGKSRGFGYVEFKNDSDYMKGLSLDRSFLKNRRIYIKDTPNKNNKKNNALKKFAVANTKKLHAPQKAGKFPKFSKLQGIQDKTQKKK